MSGLPSWSDIVDDVRSKLKKAGRKNLEKFDFLQSVQFYEDLFGRKALLDLLVDKIRNSGAKSNICHDMIARLPVKTMITTNWDTLLEETYEKTYGIKPVVIWKDAQVGFEAQSQGATIIKMHGCITDPCSLVFSEQDYLNYLRLHPLIVDLVSTKLANSPMLFIGYSVRDIDFKLMLERITSHLGNLVPSKHILLANETYEEAQYLGFRGFSPILYRKENSTKTGILEHFLTKLTDDVAICAYTKLDRAKILVRENKSQLKYADPSFIIRNSANLGAWAVPKPRNAKTPLFDSKTIDKLEWQASRTWETFYKKGVRFKCIYCINAEWMLRKYSLEHAEKRLRVFLNKLQHLDGTQVQIVSKDFPFDSSQTIFNNDVLLSLTKTTPADKTYTHAEVIRNKLVINSQITLFDSYFEAIKQSNLAEAQRQNICDRKKTAEQNLHQFIVKRTKEALTALHAK